MSESSKLVAIMVAIISVIAEMPEGAPSGVVYAGVQGHVTFDEYMDIISVCKSKGWITESNNLLKPTPALLILKAK